MDLTNRDLLTWLVLKKKIEEVNEEIAECCRNLNKIHEIKSLASQYGFEPLMSTEKRASLATYYAGRKDELADEREKYLKAIGKLDEMMEGEIVKK